MTTSLDRWEKDPFFAAAEEVQESADRFVCFVILISQILVSEFLKSQLSLFVM